MWLLVVLMVVSSYGLLRDAREGRPYSSFCSFNRTLDRKMDAYPYSHGMGWLKVYMNLFLPFYLIFAILSITDAIYAAQSGATGEALLRILCLALLILLLAADLVLIRDIGRTAFRLNQITLVAMAVSYILPAVPSMIRMPEGIALDLLFTLVIAGWTAGNLSYFHVRSELFLKSEAELRRDYGSRSSH